MALRTLSLAVATTLLVASAACSEDTFPDRRRTHYNSFEDEVYAIIEREFEVIEPRQAASARLQLLRSQTDPDDQERFPGLYVKEALRAAVLPPVNLDLRQSLENDAALSLFDDGSMRQMGEFLSVSFERMLVSTRPGGQSARVPEALANLNRAAGGPNPNALMHLMHRMTNVDTVEIPSDIPLGADPELERVSASLIPGMVTLYARQGEAVERLHVWLAGELQSYGISDGASAPAIGGTATVDPIWERLLAPICKDLRDLGVKADCEAAREALDLGAPVFTVDVDAQGAPVRTEEGLSMGDLVPFANPDPDPDPDPDLPRVLRGTDPLSDVGMAFNPLTGGKAFVYENVKDSLLALLVDSQRRVLKKGYIWDIARIAPLLMGEHTPFTGDGYAADENLLLDLMWAVKELRSYPRLPILLKVQAELFHDGEGLRQLQSVLGAFGRATACVRGKELLTPGNELFDHLFGKNPLRDLEVGKKCGFPSGVDDLCSSQFLWCDFGDDNPDPAPMDSGRCKLREGMFVPSILEELAEPGGWLRLDGGETVGQEPILRKLFRQMSQDSRMLGMSAGLAEMMGHSVTNDLTAIVDLECADLEDGTLDDLHAQGFKTETQWDSPEGHPDPEGLADDGDPTRSMNQKLMDLIYDTNRAPFDPDVIGREGVGVLLIPNQATFYMDAAVGNVDISSRYLNGKPDYTGFEEGISSVAESIMCETSLKDEDDDGLTPTAEQLDLFMLRNHDTGNIFVDTGNPTGNLGFPVRTRLASALTANVASKNLEALKPIIEVVSRYGQSYDEPRNIRLAGGRTQLLIDTLSTLHMHYSEHERNKDREFDAGLGRPDFDRQFGTGFRRAEREAVRIATDTCLSPTGMGKVDLFTAFTQFGALLDRFEVCLEKDDQGACRVGRTVNAADEMVTFVAWLLDRDAHVRPRPERHERWGVVDEEGKDKVELLNGPMTGRRNPTIRERRPSRLHLLVEAFRLIDDRLKNFPDALLAWNHLDFLNLLVGVDLATPEKPATGDLANPGTPWAIRGLVRLMADLEEREWKDAGCGDDLWDPPATGCAVYRADIAQGYDDAKESMADPGLASALDLFATIRDDPDLRKWVDTLMALNVHLDPDPSRDVGGAIMELAAHALRIAVDPEDTREVIRYLGSILEADAWLGKKLVPTLGRLNEADGQRQAVPALLRNLTTEDRTRPLSRFPLRVLKDVIADALREDPVSPEPFTAADYRRVVLRMQQYFVDDIRGFQRMVDVVISRLPRP